MSSPADRSEDALRLFEEFLERHHSGGADFEALCEEHAAHEPRFRRWWANLLETGEVSATPSSVVAGEEPDEGDRFGPYRVLRELGRGGQGAVFLAEDTRLLRNVALKVLPIARVHGRDPAKRFAREAELASRLDHPGLCAVFERGVHRNTAFLAMRFVEGETLAAFVARARRRAESSCGSGAVRLPGADGEVGELDEREAIGRVLVLFEKVARALHTAHEARLVHRDVKPGNVIVDRRGEPVVLDFGLARDVGDEGPALTRTGDAVGTPAYMSPEQISGRGDVDRRADVYALGATLYECLTLHRPAEAATRAELYRRILDIEPLRARRLNPALPRDLDTVLDTALQKEPGARYRTAEDFAEDLRRVRARETILARPAGPLVRGWRWAQRNRGIAASLLALFVALAGGLVVSVVLQAETRRAQREEREMLARLTDGVRLDQAERAALAMFPIGARSAGALERWLAELGEPLAAALPAHRVERDALRVRALPVSDAERDALREGHPQSAVVARLRMELLESRRQLEESVRRNRFRWFESFATRLEQQIADGERVLDGLEIWRFEASSDQALHDALTGLVARLERFVAADGLLDRMRAHYAWASTCEARIEGDLAAVWRDAIEYAARPDGAYGGLVLAPEPGLVPLGRDPESELLEFAFERSGTIPAREAGTRRLVVDAGSAIVLVLLPGGTYRMGRVIDAQSPSERFERDVELEPFLVGKHELSRQQWRTLGRRDPPDDPIISVMFEAEPGHPVDFVCWEEAVEVLGEFGLELPTEAQWEYAAAGGTRTTWWWGDDVPPLDGRLYDNLRDRSFEREAGRLRRIRDDGYAALAPVHAGFVGNGFGLVAVHGNVAEWCRDAFVPKLALDEFDVRAGDGLHVAPRLGMFAVRGGRFDSPSRETYVGARGGLLGGLGHVGVGVRVVRRLQ